MSLSQLESLQSTLNTAIDAYKAELVAQNLTEPRLDSSKGHAMDDINFLPSPIMFEAQRLYYSRRSAT